MTAAVELADADAKLVVTEHGLWCGHGSDLADITGDGIADATPSAGG